MGGLLVPGRECRRATALVDLRRSSCERSPACMPVQRTVRPLHRHGLRSDQTETVRILYGAFRGSRVLL